MNKTELKNFAISARRDLLEKVALRAKIFGIDENSGFTIEDKFGQLAINGETYSNDKKSAFLSLKKQLETKGYEQLIEEVAYTWFNRIIAIRYMEVNDYLPERVNVLSSSTGKVEPDILSQFETMDLNIDAVKTKDLSRQGETENAYRQLFIAQCNALNKILPFMFEKIQDYTELLLPDYLLDSESVIKKLISNEALTESFTEVEVIGWLYQFYNSEPKDKVFANLKKNKKVEKYDIPAATQLFTPKWIVQYMVQNSLGQLWLESNPESPLKESMSYYIKPAEQDEDVKQKLEEILYKNVNLEEITIIDPCVGSGHILVYAFELLYQMYEEAGYPIGDIPQLILEKNLYGLDIDDRAAQLASFALMMKAREKSRRIFRKQIELNIYSIQESNFINQEGIAELICQNDIEKREIYSLIENFIDAKNFGSILMPEKNDFQKYITRINNLADTQLTIETYSAFNQLPSVLQLLRQAILLSTEFDVSITNPPYMSSRGMNDNLNNYLKKNFQNSKSDFFSVFIERLNIFSKENAFFSLITQPSWLFLGNFHKLRKEIISNNQICTLLHMGRGIFGIDFGSTAFTLRKTKNENYAGKFFRLHERTFQYLDPNDIEAILLSALKDSNTRVNFQDYTNGYIPFDSSGKQISFTASQRYFNEIPQSPIVYWISDKVRILFKNNINISEKAEPRQGMATADNDRFLRRWNEVDINKIGFYCVNSTIAMETKRKWFPYNKGGSFRRWYGNQDYVVNWESNGREIKSFKRAVVRNEDYYFRKGITWSDVSSGSFGIRYTPEGFIFDVKGSSIFIENEDELPILQAYMSSKLVEYFLNILNPTISFQVGDLKRVPYIQNVTTQIHTQIYDLSLQNINISRSDWDSFEHSWKFKCHPLIIFSKDKKILSAAFNNWEEHTEFQFRNLKANEEELNRIFIDLYGLEDEMTPEVIDEEITIRKSDRIRDAKSFLSYFIGCTIGRYSLDADSLAYAGGEWDKSKYRTFIPNKFGLIQLTDEHYFENDIIARLIEFLSLTFDVETIEDNLQWLAESLELKRNETAEGRLRRYFLDEFFKDHCQVYQKRPIYWLVDSGKQKGLRTLIYMHRYQPDTMATIRFEHLQEIQAKYNNEIAAVDLRIVNPNLSATEKRDLEKRKTAFQERLEELLEFDKNLAEYANAQIAIDLDDGVNVNYEKFDKVLAKIK